MKTIGITGPTGCGKTTFLQEIAAHGGVIVDCDALYYELLAYKEGAALRQETKRPLAVLCADEQEARRMAADLAALTGEECVTLFAREWQLRDRVSASHSFEQERLDALCRMAFGRTGIVEATVDGMMQRTLPPTALRDAVLTLRLGEEHDLRALAERLTAAGYVRCEQVEGAGQFAVRGGILDVYSPMSAAA